MPGNGQISDCNGAEMDMTARQPFKSIIFLDLESTGLFVKEQAGIGKLESSQEIEVDRDYSKPVTIPEKIPKITEFAMVSYLTSEIYEAIKNDEVKPRHGDVVVFQCNPDLGENAEYTDDIRNQLARAQNVSDKAEQDVMDMQDVDRRLELDGTDRNEMELTDEEAETEAEAKEAGEKIRVANELDFQNNSMRMPRNELGVPENRGLQTPKKTPSGGKGDAPISDGQQLITDHVTRSAIKLDKTPVKLPDQGPWAGKYSPQCLRITMTHSDGRVDRRTEQIPVDENFDKNLLYEPENSDSAQQESLPPEMFITPPSAEGNRINDEELLLAPKKKVQHSDEADPGGPSTSNGIRQSIKRKLSFSEEGEKREEEGSVIIYFYQRF